MRRCGCCCKIRHTHIHARTKTNSRKKRNSLFVKEITGEKKARATLPLLCTHSQYVLSTGCVWCEATNTIRDTTTMHNAMQYTMCHAIRNNYEKNFERTTTTTTTTDSCTPTRMTITNSHSARLPMRNARKQKKKNWQRRLQRHARNATKLKILYYEVMVDAAHRSPQQRRHSQ